MCLEHLEHLAILESKDMREREKEREGKRGREKRGKEKKGGRGRILNKNNGICQWTKHLCWVPVELF
jgi:hypothetical protein